MLHQDQKKGGGSDHRQGPFLLSACVEEVLPPMLLAMHASAKSLHVPGSVLLKLRHSQYG